MKNGPSIFLQRVFLVCLCLGPLANSLAAEKPSPQVSASLRGVTAQTLGQCEPWRVFVRVDLPRGSKGTVELSPASGTWADALTVELLPATGMGVAARAEPMGKPDVAAATLDAKHVAGGLWRFSPETMQAVAPGSYRLRVQFKIDTGQGWKGVAAAREIPLTVVASAVKPSVAAMVNRAQDLLLTDKVQDAATLVDAELRNAPRDYALLKVRALIAEKAGNPFAASMCLNAANFSTVKKTAGQPPAEDREMLVRLEKSRKTASANPPAWTWPPAEVLTALAQEAQKSSFAPAMPPERPAGARNETAPTVPANPPPRTPVPSNSVTVATRNPTAAAPLPPTPVQLPVALANAATPLPAAPAEPPPGVIVPFAELNDAKIAADTTGQWAAAAKAGSQYSSPTYSAAKATGALDVPIIGDSPSAWCPVAQSGGNDWLEVFFAKPVSATEVRIRQSNCPGAIVKIEAIEADGTAHVWWEGTDSYKPSAVREVVWFAMRVPKTPYLVAKVKITLNLAAVPGWKQIDAVQLVGAAP